MRPFSFSPRLLTTAVITTVLGLAACNKTPEAKPEAGSVIANSTAYTLHSSDGSFIALTDAVAMTQAFQLAHPTMSKGQFFGRDLVLKLLAQPNAVGIRIYNAEQDGLGQYVLVGAEADNTDQYARAIIASGPRCPNCCAPSSPFSGNYSAEGDYVLHDTDGEELPLPAATQLTERFRANHPDMSRGQFYGKKMLLELLDQNNCAGLRIYNAQQEGKDQYVLVGATQSNDDQLNGLLLASGPDCPSCCAMSSPLNE